MNKRINDFGFSPAMLVFGIGFAIIISGLVYSYFFYEPQYISQNDLHVEVSEETADEEISPFYDIMANSNYSAEDNVESVESTPSFRIQDKDSGPEVEVDLNSEAYIETETGEEPAEETMAEEPGEESKLVPENNDSPKVFIVTDGLEDEELSKDKPVYLISTAIDVLGGISHVDFYIDDEVISTVEPRDLHATVAQGWDSRDVEEATEMAVEYLGDKFKDHDAQYIYRKYYKYDVQDSGCDIERGYMLIMLGDEDLYEIRISEDLGDIDLCYKGSSINYNDNYISMFEEDDGDYTFYVRAYDIYGEQTQSEIIDFELD